MDLELLFFLRLLLDLMRKHKMLFRVLVPRHEERLHRKDTSKSLSLCLTLITLLNTNIICILRQIPSFVVVWSSPSCCFEFYAYISGLYIFKLFYTACAYGFFLFLIAKWFLTFLEVVVLLQIRALILINIDDLNSVLHQQTWMWGYEDTKWSWIENMWTLFILL